MSEWWKKHRAKIFGALVGVASTVGLVAATMGCNKLPPGLSNLCVVAAQELANEARKAAQENSGAGGDASSSSPTSPSSALELCPGGPDGPLCTSTGYALPMEDGGKCRCR
jgi:hypothetical protein